MKSTSTETSKTAQEISTILLEIGCIILRPSQPFRYNTGILSPIYTDNRLLLSMPRERKKVISALVKLVKKIGVPDVIAGTATAGIPHAAYISNILNIPMIYVRAEAKKYAWKNQVEGILKRKQKVLVVDDLISTGRSSLEVVRAIRKKGGLVRDVVAITSYGLKEAEDNFKKNNVKLHYLTDINTSCEIARKKGYLTEEKITIIKTWAKNPSKWNLKN